MMEPDTSVFLITCDFPHDPITFTEEMATDYFTDFPQSSCLLEYYE